MATRSRNGDHAKTAARLSPPGEAAGIAGTLTTTLLAGAVTGAVVQAREASAGQPAQAAAPAPMSASLSPERHGSERQPPIEQPTDGGQGAPAGVIRPDEGGDGPPAEASAMPASRTASAFKDGEASVEPVARTADAASVTGMTPEATPPAEAAAAAATWSTLLSPETTALSAIDARPPASTSMSGLDERIEAAVVNLREAAISLNDTLSSSAGETLDRLSSAIDGSIASLHAEVATLGEEISGRIDAALATAGSAIPASILGASETDDDRPGDFLARLLGTLEDAPAAPVTPVVSPAAEVGEATKSEIRFTPDQGQPFTDIFDLGDAVGALKIGFAGQSYTEADPHDGPSPHHANLLQGML